MTQKKPRTEVKDLPREKKELSKEEQKKVKGGNLVIEAGPSAEVPLGGRPKFDDIKIPT